MRYLLVVIFLIIAFYALRSPRKGGPGSGNSQGLTVKDNVAGTYGETHVHGEADPNAKFESSFEEGLPEDYVPSSISRYSDIQKLKDDYDYRWNKLHRHFEEEKKELLANREYSKEKMEQLIEKQNRAKEEFQKAHRLLRAEMENRIKEERSSRDKGLR